MDTGLNYTLNLKDYFKKTMLSAQQATATLDSNMGKLQGTINRAGNALIAAFAVNKIKDFGAAVVESLKNYQYFTASIRTMLHGDANAAAALQGQLVNLAKTTPFSLVDVQNSAKQLLAYGFKAKDLVGVMRTLGDVSSGVGAPLQDIAYLYGTLKTSGRVMQVDLRQFAGRGIPIYESLAKVLGVTQSRINSMVTEGKIGFRDVENAFKSMTKEGGQFFNLMDDQSKTVGGRLSNLGDAWEQLKVNIGKSQTGIINATISWASSMVQKLTDITEVANKTDLAFASASKNNGGKPVQNLNYTWMETLEDWITGGNASGPNLSGKSKGDALQRSLQSAFINVSSRSKADALGAQAGVLRLMSSFGKAFSNKEISKLEYDRAQALMSSALNEIKSNINLFGAKPSSPGKDDENGMPGAIGSPVDVSGARPQNITINVESLVRTLNLYSQNQTQGMNEAKAITSKALLEVLNDANLIANR